jgi:hypothetical protein
MSFMTMLSTLGPLKGMFHSEDEEDLKLLEQAISLLRLSTLYCLGRKLTPVFGPDGANALAVAVLSHMILEPPQDETFAAFREKHRKDIEAQALEARKHEDLCGPSGCASYLYSAEILHSAMLKMSRQQGTAQKEKSPRALEEQASRLGIAVPTVLEICDSNNRAKCVEAIYSFAKAFYYTNTWAAPSPPLAELPLPSLPHSYDFLSNMLLHNSAALAGAADTVPKAAGVEASTGDSGEALVSNSDVS